MVDEARANTRIATLADQVVRRIRRDMFTIAEEAARRWVGTFVRGGRVDAGVISGQIPLSSLPPHQSTHQSGGGDALTGLVDANARVSIAKNGTVIGTRRQLNLTEGTNVSLIATDNAANERVDVTISAAGGGSMPWRQVVLRQTGNKTTTSTAWVPIDEALLVLNLYAETGQVVRCTLCAQMYQSAQNVFGLDFDVLPAGSSTPVRLNDVCDFGATCKGNDKSRTAITVISTWTATSTGTHRFRPVWRTSSGQTVTAANATTGNDNTAILFMVENIGTPV